MKIETEADEILVKEVKGKGKGKITSGYIYLPIKWIGRKVEVLLKTKK